MNKILQFILLHGYALLFSWSFLAQFGLPLPAAPLFLAAGALAGMEELHLAAIFGVGVFGTFLSDFIWYEIGRSRGGECFHFCAESPWTRIPACSPPNELFPDMESIPCWFLSSSLG